MTAEERQWDIESQLLVSKKIQVDELSKRYGVSEVTIRKDLNQLELRGVLLRTHGGAVLAERPELVVSMHRRSLEQIEEKDAMARAAARRVRDGETILLDSGSSTLALAKHLRGRNLTIVTNSIHVAMELGGDEHISMVVLGGTLRRSSLALMGASLVKALEHLHIDRAFMGTSGFDARTGFACQNLIEAETKQAMLKCAREVVLLVDSSKFEKAAFAHFCSMREAQIVITDAAPPKLAADALRKAGVTVIVVRDIPEPAVRPTVSNVALPRHNSAAPE